MWRTSFYTALGLFILSLSLVFLVNEVFKLGVQIHSAEYCEFTDLDSWIRQPINTLSNLGFFFVGCLIFTDLKNKKKSFIKSHRQFAYLAGLTSILIGLTSVLFHGVYVTWSRELDSTFTFAGALVLIVLMMRLRKKTQPFDTISWYDGVIALMTLVIVWVFYLLQMYAMYLVFAIVAASLILGYLQRRANLKFENKFLWLAVSLFVIAFILRQIDISKVGCLPHSIWQLHGAWHLLSAGGFWGLYRYLRSAN